MKRLILLILAAFLIGSLSIAWGDDPDLLVSYTFREGKGGTIRDVSGVGDPLDLVVEEPANVSWIPGGGLLFKDVDLAKTEGPATKVIEGCKASNEITIVAWVKPDNLELKGPARIFTCSTDPNNRNFTLGQDTTGYRIRLRTTVTGNNGYNPPHKSDMSAYVFKLSPDGSELIWATYFGAGEKFRDIDIDDYGNVYITLMGVSVPSPYITPGAFQTELSGGKDNVIAKLSSHGSHIIWASYLGGSGNDIAPSIRVDADGYVYVDGSTTSADFPVTESAYQTVHAGSEDAFAAKFRPDGSGLEYATFLGGSQSDGAAGKHGLAVDEAGYAYVVGFTSSPDFPTTEGAFQTQYAGGLTGNWEQTGDRFIAKISPDGRHLLASAFVGGNQRDGGEGIAVDDQGKVYLSTFTYSDDFPVNDDAMQRENAAVPDGVAFILAADFSYAELSTYMGGSGNDNFRACAVGPDGSLVIVGSTNSPDWPTRNAMQSTFGGGSDDIIVVKISPGNP